MQGHKLVREDHAKQGNLRLDSKAAILNHFRENHGNGVPVGWRQAAATSYFKRALKGCAFGIWVPSMPVLNVLVDLEDCSRGGRHFDSMFNLHEEKNDDESFTSESERGASPIPRDLAP